MTPPTIDPAATWPLFLAAHAAVVGAIEQRLKDAGLPPLEWYDVLWALERAPDGRLRMHALADQLVLTRFNVTRLVDRLEREGLVERQRSEDDRRGASAVLTAAGRALRKRMWPVYRRAIETLFERHVAAAEHAAMQRALRGLLDAQRGSGTAASRR